VVKDDTPYDVEGKSFLPTFNADNDAWLVLVNFYTKECKKSQPFKHAQTTLQCGRIVCCRIGHLIICFLKVPWLVGDAFSYYGQKGFSRSTIMFSFWTTTHL
jgi:hypothetical protein